MFCAAAGAVQRNRQTSPRLDHLHKSWDTILDSKIVQGTFT
jgi:hypothetical protein